MVGPIAWMFCMAATAAAAGAPNPVVGVVRGAEGASLTRGLLRVGDRLQTDETGWVEVHLAGRGRLRLFPRTEVQLREGPSIRLLNGRIWYQAHAETPLILRGGGGRVDAKTSVILEDTRSGGLVVTTLAGRAHVGSVEIGPGLVWRRPLLGAALSPKRGGAQLADLLRTQVAATIGDWSGIESWLQTELRKAEIGAPKGLSVAGVVRSEQEAAASTSSGVLTEAALRPPPFFEEEVPSRGPNVRVEVGFRDD